MMIMMELMVNCGVGDVVVLVVVVVVI